MTEPDTTRRGIHWPRVTRDGILFVVGIAGIVHEAVVSKVDRPSLLIVFAAMCGLPAFLRVDEKRRNGS